MCKYFSQPAPTRRDALQCVSTTEPPEKFQKKYRISSARLKNYDYGEDGAYFVTICTKNREPFFGEIVKTQDPESLHESQMQLSEIGEIIQEEWQKTAEIRKNITLGEFVIMPNHFHAVVIIQNGVVPVETHCNASLQNPIQPIMQYKNQFGPQSHNLSAIIRGFKGATTKQIHIAGFPHFSWQPRFHEHIIRNEIELSKISEYIFNNPQNWEQDDYF